MNSRHFFKPASLLRLFVLLALVRTTATAQDTNSVPSPPPGYGADGSVAPLPSYETRAKANADECDIQIENGRLLVAPLRKHADLSLLWGPAAHDEPATISTLASYLRLAHTNLNIVLSPDAGNVTVGNLKMRSDDIRALFEAISVATDGAVQGQPMSGKDNWAITTASSQRGGRTIEAFNLTGYIQTLGKVSDETVQRSLNEIQALIIDTLTQLHPVDSRDLSFRYHPGTHLLIVTGKPDAIEVTRKIINALSGQQKNGREDLLDITLPSNQN